MSQETDCFREKNLDQQITRITNDLQSKVSDIIHSRNLKWPLIFCFLCFFSFWSEMTNYHYHKYYSKWLPMVGVIINMMIFIEQLSKDFYNRFAYADYTAIGIMSTIPGSILMMIEENGLVLVPALCMTMIMNVFYSLGCLSCMIQQRRKHLTENTLGWQFVVLGLSLIFYVSYINSQIILSMIEYKQTYLIYGYVIIQAIMVTMQILRVQSTLRRSYGYTCTGAIMEFVGTSVFFCVRSKTLNHWIFRLMWICLQNFGQFLICKGMLIHCLWWEKQLIAAKLIADKNKLIEWQKKKAYPFDSTKIETDNI